MKKKTCYDLISHLREQTIINKVTTLYFVNSFINYLQPHFINEKKKVCIQEQCTQINGEKYTYICK